MNNNIMHRETNFEKYISSKILELSTDNSWRISNYDTGFDPNTALVMDDFIEYFETIEPLKAEKMKKSMGSNWISNLTKQLVKSLEVNGTVYTLRNGFSMAGYQTIRCSGQYPDDPRLPDLKKYYDANILRVMHQVHYQTAGNKSLDLVFFINGIPVATAEVKTNLTQTVQDAIIEYQVERKPIEPDTRRKNYLLMFKRGAIVHFAISESEIYMCTNLEPDKPKFLPFNIGNNGHAGNPPLKDEDTDYPTGYFWNTICQKDNWLKIFHNFIFEEVTKKPDATGRIKEVATQIFPRYHQWNCVTKCIDDVKQNGVGQRYLIEHSAGSGKTATISWIAHELIRLMDSKGDRLFSSVIVVTDRTVLDSNIKKTIKQLKKTVGLIATIGGDDIKKTSGAKSKELSEALINKNEIIVVTLQTFPYALDAIANNEKLAGCNFAVLIDEAHSGQNGQYSTKMKAALSLASKKKKKANDDTEVTDEELINAYIQQEQSTRSMPSNVSFFAFTATPKYETKIIFGRPGDKIDPKSGEHIPESFDLYPMRQAIEEGYILDVLTGYMPYKTAYKLKEDIVPDKLVDERSALRTIAKWQNLHPTNVMAKAEFIIEHFIKNVSPLLDGTAKAMIVTSSRAAVVRYKYAIDAYLKAHPEYDKDRIGKNLQIKVAGDPLVAFSGKVNGNSAVMPEDEEVVSEFDYLKENPFALIKRDYDYTENEMNNLGYQSIENAFENDVNRRILIVADKFQTGFDQPKLCAMYIDKKISNDIEIVQTYSRLNRTYAGKDTVFIVDFMNDPEKVLKAFKKYDVGAQIKSTQDLDIIYGIKEELDLSEIYTQSDLNAYKEARYSSIIDLENNKDNYRKKLYNSVSEPADRWVDAYKNNQTAYATWINYAETVKVTDPEKYKYALTKIEEIEKDVEKLLNFRKKLRKYCSAYVYITQIVDLEEPDLEVFYGFAKLLFHRLQGNSLDEIDTKVLVLSDYKINKLDIDNPNDDNDNETVLRPMRVGGKGKTGKKESLKEIVVKINEIFGPEADKTESSRAINAIADYVAADDITRTQIRNSTNSKEAVISEGRLENIIKMAAMAIKNNDLADYAEKILNDPQTWKPLAEIIFDMIDKKEHIDISDVVKYSKGRKK